MKPLWVLRAVFVTLLLARFALRCAFWLVVRWNALRAWVSMRLPGWRHRALVRLADGAAEQIILSAAARVVPPAMRSAPELSPEQVVEVATRSGGSLGSLVCSRLEAHLGEHGEAILAEMYGPARVGDVATGPAVQAFVRRCREIEAEAATWSASWLADAIAQVRKEAAP